MLLRVPHQSSDPSLTPWLSANLVTQGETQSAYARAFQIPTTIELLIQPPLLVFLPTLSLQDMMPHCSPTRAPSLAVWS